MRTGHTTDYIPIVKIAYNASGYIEYIGYAAPQSETSDSVWKIINFSYDASDNITGLTYAEGTTNHDKIWDNRAEYVYS